MYTDKNYDAFFDKLQRSGVNTIRTIDRFGGLTDLYVKFLDEFADTERFTEIFDNISSGRIDDAEMGIHKLKGVLGNLGMEALYNESEIALKDIQTGRVIESQQRLRQMQPKVIELQRIIKTTQHEQ